MPRSDRTFLRPRQGSVLGGVCAALARAAGLDVSVVRSVFFGLFLVTAPIAYFWLPALFLAPLVYSAFWLGIPRE
ncbi:PspC domain-containing protein [Engelhardtia mirabilis]|uniref:PspC domain protein n=1 Tax=Engelhardtia mirabilis TaxID=2528011 RepID=A0A518BRI8_9BACT|nr:PspC domain protein [Planctomycetes bacterium Pla133]QDV03914.1 PspC domain protein [Planctomycetes bacterium Pla86]